MLVTLLSVMVLFTSLITASGCTLPTKINDRLTYATEKVLVERYKKAPAIDFVIDEATKKYQFDDTPSGIIGSLSSRQFPIGWTFAAYLEQAARAALRPPSVNSAQVGVHLSTCKMRYTNSAAGTGVDWVEIILTIDTTFPGQATPVPIKVRREVDAPAEETVQMDLGDRAIVRAMEGLVTDFIDEVIKHMSYKFQK